MGIPAVVPPPAPPAPVDPVYGLPAADGQVSVGGLLLDPAIGSPIKLMMWNPYGVPSIRDADEDRNGDDGSWTGPDYLPALQVAFTARIFTPAAPDNAVALLQALTAAMAPSATEVDITWQRGGVRYVRHGKSRQVDPDTSNLGVGLIDVQLGFVATDPRYYTLNDIGGDTQLPLPAAGVPIPMDIPAVIPAAPQGGTVRVTNAGTTTTRPLMRLVGPWANPGVLIRGTGLHLSYGLTLGAGDVLTVDCRRGSALLNGVSFRAPTIDSTVTSRFVLQPGTSVMAMTGDVVDSAHLPSLVVSAQSAYI